MITHIEVDGFKTLNDFRIDLRPGLNILVGPNGSGKTNIVSFFEFLAHLMDTDASEAISRVGGAGTVFRRSGKTFHNRITATIQGIVHPSEHQDRDAPEESNLSWQYAYQFCLYFPESRDAVLFERQNFKIRGFVGQPSLTEGERWDCDIEVRINPNGGLICEVPHFNRNIFKELYIPRTKKGQEPSALIKELFERFLRPGVAIIPMGGQFAPQLWRIEADLSGGKTYNIVPSRVKQLEDSARPPGISRDGAGLAATIYRLKKITESNYFSGYTFAPRRDIQANPETITILRDYLRLVNSAIQDFDVENDHFDNQLKLRFKVVGCHNEDTWVPSSYISDGTLKWIALVAAALTEPSVFSIEEPENYLHPSLQRKIVTVLREILFRNSENKVTIMTTHSETLLNSCKPEELIITYFSEGSTKARRCSNAVDISDEINRTGFGLGYFYLTEALSYE